MSASPMAVSPAHTQEKTALDIIRETGIQYENIEIYPLELVQIPKPADYPQGLAKKIEEAQNALKKGDIPRTIDLYEKLYKSHKKDIKIANMYAALLLSQKDFQTSERVLKSALKQEPDNIIALANMASCCIHQFDYSKRVEAMLVKALEKSPATAEIHHNVGVFYHRQGKIEQAAKGYRNARMIKPTPQTLCGLGMISTTIGNMKEAKKFYEDAQKLSPRVHQAHLGMAQLAMYENPPNPDKAFMHAARAVNCAPNDFATISYFIYICTRVRNGKFSPETINAITHTLMYKHAQHKYLFALWAHYVLRASQLEAFERLYRNADMPLDPEGWEKIYDCLEQPILWLGIKQLVLRNLNLESALTRIRKHILDNAEKIQEAPKDFLYALAEQCFFNEYIFEETPEETNQLKALIDDIENRPAKDQPFLIALVACYRPLIDVPVLRDYAPILEKAAKDQRYTDLITLNIKEPQEEQIIKQSIKTIGSIENQTSQAVKGQYEVHPYPRWKHDVMLRDSERRLRELVKPDTPPQILVAGCGTGKQVVQAKIMRYRNAHFTCVDLSSSSLAYAIRKTKELNLRDIDYYMGDILELGCLDKKFDYILCTGVLHHMKDPMAGWRVLTSLLKDDGVMNIGLYSELVRKPVVATRAYIKEQKIIKSDDGIATLEDIRKLRRDIKNMPADHPMAGIRNWNDFYTTSMCRDLVFHVQEHRFTIPQIQDCLDELGLEFMEFRSDAVSFSKKLEQNPEMKGETDLKKWHEFEQRAPELFRAMYQFHCRKKTNKII